MIKIDKGIPITGAQHGNIKYPFDSLEVGDSFAVTVEECPHMRSGLSRRGKELGAKFTSRRLIENGVKVVRVWSVE